MSTPGQSDAKGNGFEIGLLLLTALLAGAFLFAKSAMSFPLAEWKVYVLLATFALLTYISHRSMRNSIDGRPAQFANRFMGSILLKLFIGFIVFIIIALMSDNVEVLPFGISFLVVYLVYTVFGSYQATRLKSGAGSKE